MAILSATVAPRGWGLATTDAKCLQTVLYLRVSRTPCVYRESAYPYDPKTGPLPMLCYDIEQAGRDGCMRFLKRFCDLDQFLPNVQRADAVAYAQLAEDTLRPVEMFLTWAHVDAKARQRADTAANAHYARGVPFPVSSFLRMRQRHRVKAVLTNLKLETAKDAIDLATRGYKSLSIRLGHHLYFSQTERPGSLDVCVAAFVAVHYHIPVPNNPIKKLLDEEYPQLVRHFQGLLAAYSPPYEVTCEMKEDDHRDADQDSPVPDVLEPTPGSVLRQREADRKEEEALSKQNMERDLRRRRQNQIAIIASVLIFGVFVRHNHNKSSEG